MKIIDRAADLMETGATGGTAFKELSELEQRIRELTEKEIDITNFAEYWEWTTLEEIARDMLSADS